MEELKYEVKNDIKSEVSYFDIDNSIFDFLNINLKEKEYLVVAYLDYEVKIGYLRKNQEVYRFIFSTDEKLEEKFIQKIRVFNENVEVFIWRSKNHLKGRHRKDQVGKDSEYVDVNQVLFGTDTNKDLKDDNFTELLEIKRGIKFTIAGKFESSENRKRVAIKTRNYIEYNDIHQATYSDCRFIKFVQLGV